MPKEIYRTDFSSLWSGLAWIVARFSQEKDIPFSQLAHFKNQSSMSRNRCLDDAFQNIRADLSLLALDVRNSVHLASS
jgi:hypothetical protein